jgi:DNA-directed RNA polymerase beta subunit
VTEKNPAKLKRFLEEKAIIDYIDTNESEGALISFPNKEFIKKNNDKENNDKVNNDKEERENDNKNKKYTHMEIHESFLFGMMSNLISFPENNPATRNSFSCGQSKQACSLYHTNHHVIIVSIYSYTTTYYTDDPTLLIDDDRHDARDV